MEEGEIQIPVTDEVMAQLKDMRENQRFIELKNDLQESPERLSEMLGFIRTNYPGLHDVFSEQPRFLMAVLAGETPEFEEEEEEGGEEGRADLSETDWQNIRSVR